MTKLKLLKATIPLDFQAPKVPENNIEKFTDSLVGIEFDVRNIERTFNYTSNKKYSEEDLVRIKDSLGKENATKIRNAFNTSYVVQPFNPWDTLNQMFCLEKI